MNPNSKRRHWRLHAGLATLAIGLFLRYVASVRGDAGDFAVGLFLGLAITLLIASIASQSGRGKRV